MPLLVVFRCVLKSYMLYLHVCIRLLLVRCQWSIVQSGPSFDLFGKVESKGHLETSHTRIPSSHMQR